MKYVLPLAAATMVLVTSAAPSRAQGMSPQDVVSNARLQALMRMCNEQIREALPSDANQHEVRQAVLECLRDNRAGLSPSGT